MNWFHFAAVIACLGATTPAVAQNAPTQTAPTSAGSDILQNAINQPGTNWSVYGPNQKVKAVKAVGVPGEEALRVTVSAQGKNAWDVGALSPIQKPIAAGDTILVAAYLRAPGLKPGETTPVPFIGVTGAAEPYPPIVSASVAIGPEWKMYYAAGKATTAFAAGAARGSVHLAGAKHVVELGPIFVLDFGPNQDPAKLPKN